MHLKGNGIEGLNRVSS